MLQVFGSKVAMLHAAVSNLLVVVKNLNFIGKRRYRCENAW